MMSNSALFKLPHDAFRFEAMKICHLRGIDDESTMRKIEAGLRYEAFRREIDPITRKIARIHMLAMPTMIIRDGQVVRTGDGLTSELRAIVEQYHEMISRIAKHYGYETMTDSALSRLANGELCIVVVDGKQREAQWVKHNNWFRYTTPPAGIVLPADVEEWWPASVKF